MKTMLNNIQKYLEYSRFSHTFVALLEEAKILTFICAVFFIATALYANSLGYHSNGYCAEKSVIASSKAGLGSLSSFNTLIFWFMEEAIKNQSSPKNSKTNLTPAGATSDRVIAKSISSSKEPTESGNPADITVIVTGKRNNQFVYVICKATYELFVELSKGHIFSELRFQKKFEAASLLYPEDMKALIGKTIKMM